MCGLKLPKIIKKKKKRLNTFKTLILEILKVSSRKILTWPVVTCSTEKIFSYFLMFVSGGCSFVDKQRINSAFNCWFANVYVP